MIRPDREDVQMIGATSDAQHRRTRRCDATVHAPPAVPTVSEIRLPRSRVNAVSVPKQRCPDDRCSVRARRRGAGRATPPLIRHQPRQPSAKDEFRSSRVDAVIGSDREDVEIIRAASDAVHRRTSSRHPAPDLRPSEPIPCPDSTRSCRCRKSEPTANTSRWSMLRTPHARCCPARPSESRGATSRASSSKSGSHAAV